MNIETGEVVDNSVNIHDAQVVGTTIIKNIVGWSVFGYSYKRKRHRCQHEYENIECEGRQASIDNQLLFQRLLAIASRNHVENESCLCFELNIQPASVFNKEGLVNTGNKPAVAEALWEMTEMPIPTLPTSCNLYLLDGSYLLSKLQWKKGETIQQICIRFKVDTTT